MVTDYRIPFRSIMTTQSECSYDHESPNLVEEGLSQLTISFSLADGKRQGSQNLKLDEHGIELCLRQSRLTLPFNKGKSMGLRVIKALKPGQEDTQKENSALNTSTVSSSSGGSRSNSKSRKQNKTALACLVGKPSVLKPCGREETITDKNFTFILRLNY